MRVRLSVPGSLSAGGGTYVGHLAGEKTITFIKGAEVCGLVIQEADEDTDSAYQDVADLRFNASGRKTVKLHCQYLRVKRTNGTTGTHVVRVVAEPATATASNVGTSVYENPPAASATAVEAATATSTGTRTVSFTFSEPRQLLFTVAGDTPADAPPDCAIVGEGWDARPLSETRSIPQTATTAASVNFYKKGTITYAAGQGTGATVAIGTTAKLGLKDKPLEAGGSILVLSEIAAGSVATNGTFETPTTAPPFGSYSPNSAADGARDYALAFVKA